MFVQAVGLSLAQAPAEGLHRTILPRQATVPGSKMGFSERSLLLRMRIAAAI